MSVSRIVPSVYSKVARRKRLLLILLCVLILVSTAAVAQAEAPTPPTGQDGAKDRARGFATDFPRLSDFLQRTGLWLGGREQEPLELIIDTDPGVDDAAAIVWLLSQRYRSVDVLGIVTVVGNADVYNTTNNALVLLDALSRQDIPVVMGAAAPLVQPHSMTSALLNGPDGLWFVGMENPHDLSGVPADPAAFYCTEAAAHPGATVLALGPLTNLALAAQQCPAEMAGLGQIIALGGSRTANAPMTDYNVWQDPEAAEIVLTSGLPVTLVLLEAGGQFTLGERELSQMARRGNTAAQLVLGPMNMLLEMQAGMGGEAAVAYYDVAAAIYAIRPNLGEAESALVKVVTEESISRGQTVIGLTMTDRITMIASQEELDTLVYQFYSDPNFDLFGAMYGILMAEPDNGQVVLDINERWMSLLFLAGVR
jgi:inosine-uridine nucleoside N-ribohydrolase